jgi:hypothetical protein
VTNGDTPPIPPPEDPEPNLEAARSLAGYRAPRPRATGKATGSMVCGIVGLFVCGPVLGVVAIVLAIQARREIDLSHGRVGGDGMATTGFILGIIDVALFFILLAIVAQT